MKQATTSLLVALFLYLVWTLVTWYLEGRIETLLRPDAILDRIVYAIVGGLLVGIVGSIFVVRWLQGVGTVDVADAGFGTVQRSIIAVAAGAVLGFALYVLQTAPSLDPVVVLNAYAQVFVVSAAEVLVCWSVVGATVTATLKGRGPLVGSVVGAIVASVLFGVYHYAHSAPFNTLNMTLLLTAVGLATSAFFYASRDIWGTIIFHNFLGTYGVAQALKASNKLDTLATLQLPLLGTAVFTILLLLAVDHFWLRRVPSRGRLSANPSDQPVQHEGKRK